MIINKIASVRILVEVEPEAFHLSRKLVTRAA
jgi:hypothetical protein